MLRSLQTPLTVLRRTYRFTSLFFFFCPSAELSLTRFAFLCDSFFLWTYCYCFFYSLNHQTNANNGNMAFHLPLFFFCPSAELSLTRFVFLCDSLFLWTFHCFFFNHLTTKPMATNQTFYFTSLFFFFCPSAELSLTRFVFLCDSLFLWTCFIL